jgi:hypothetical protein
VWLELNVADSPGVARSGGDLNITNDSTKLPVSQSEAETGTRLLDDWFDPIEAGLRDRARGFIQAIIEAELETGLARLRYGRRQRPLFENAGARRRRLATGTATDLDSQETWAPARFLGPTRLARKVMVSPGDSRRGRRSRKADAHVKPIRSGSDPGRA